MNQATPATSHGTAGAGLAQPNADFIRFVLKIRAGITRVFRVIPTGLLCVFEVDLQHHPENRNALQVDDSLA